MLTKLDRKKLSRIEDAQHLEWLIQNNHGAYASSTVIGMNTRREHGLLVTPHAESGKKVVVLAKLEESVFIGNHLHDISTNQYVDHVFPRGYEYLTGYEQDPFPRFKYKVDDRILYKTVFLVENSNTLIVHYDLRNQGEPVKLVIKPFLACRYSDHLSSEIQGYNTDSYQGQNFVRWAPKADMPHLSVLFTKGEYHAATLWYHNFQYRQNEDRFGQNQEDLLNPGFFEITLQPYDTFDIVFSTEDISDFEYDYESLYREQVNRFLAVHDEKHLTSLNRPALLNTIRGSVQDNKDEVSINLSHLEEKHDTRELLLAIPGLLLVPQEYDTFKKLFTNLLAKIEGGLLPIAINQPETENVEYAVDLSLWLIDLSYAYFLESGDIAYFEGKVYDTLRAIVDSYAKGTSYNIYADKDDLLFCGDKNIDLSWSKKPGQANSIRFGKLVEVNALWYNAAKILEALSGALNRKRLKSKYAKQALRIETSFNKLFFNKKTKSCYEAINFEQKSDAFTLNQIMPMALHFPVISQGPGRKILEKIDRELATPYGLRPEIVESPSKNYNKHRSSDDRFTKAVYLWTVNLYARACLNFKRDNDVIKQTLCDYFSPLNGLFEDGVIGFMPEAIFINNHPIQVYTPDSLLSSAQILWTYHLLDE